MRKRRRHLPRDDRGCVTELPGAGRLLTGTGISRVAFLAFVVVVMLVSGCAEAGEHEAVEPATPRGTAGSVTPTNTARSREPIDTRTWVTYTSGQYSLKVGRPRGWHVLAASRTWRLEADAGSTWSPAHDSLRSPSDSVRVSVFNVPLERGVRIDSVSDVETWALQYCKSSNNGPCAAVKDRAVELCVETRDCHPGLLVTFKDDVQAFFSGGIYEPDAMTVAALWRPEGSPQVARYGGARRLLEAFLSTMQVWPASTPLQERTCYGRPTVRLTCHESR